MKDNIVRMFDEADHKKVRGLQLLGFRRAGASVLLALTLQSPLSTIQIERMVPLRQPEVCKGYKELASLGIVRSERMANPRGRPILLYYLIKSMDEVTESLISEKEKAIREAAKCLKE